MKLLSIFIWLFIQDFLCIAWNCTKWISVLDGIYRHHCYLYKKSDIALNAFEANKLCAIEGHGLAPYIDINQYNYMESLRPSNAGDTFIGVMDVAVDGLWTHLDGSSIVNNDFISTFSTNQPNGVESQNCVVINSKSYSSSNKTHDKQCTTYRTNDMLCYKKDNGNCLNWTSTTDTKYRHHCYWFTNKPLSMESWTIVDAMNQCRYDGGYLAPIIDRLNYEFIKAAVLSAVFSLNMLTNTQVWLGSHFIMGPPANWNNDPSMMTFMTQRWSTHVTGNCLVIDSNLNPVRISCNTNNDLLTGAVCFKHVLDGDIPFINVNFTSLEDIKNILTVDPKNTNDGDIPFINVNFTSLEDIKDILTVDPKNTNDGDIPFINVNFTSLEDIKNILTVDPKNTNAYKLKKMSVYEDRPIAKAIGSVGVAVLISVIIFIIVLDCQRIQQCFSKKKTNKSKKRKNNQVGTSDQN